MAITLPSRRFDDLLRQTGGEIPTNGPEFALPTSMPFHEKLYGTGMSAIERWDL
jgi:hypothetical protein